MTSTNITSSRYMREGIIQFSRLNYQNATNYFQAALKHDKELVEAYNKLATIESTQKHPISCIKYCIESIQLNPSHYSSHALLGLSLLTMSKSINSVRYHDSLKSFYDTITINPWIGWIVTKLILLNKSPPRKIESIIKKNSRGIKAADLSEDETNSTNTVNTTPNDNNKNDSNVSKTKSERTETNSEVNIEEEKSNNSNKSDSVKNDRTETKPDEENK